MTTSDMVRVNQVMCRERTTECKKTHAGAAEGDDDRQGAWPVL